MPSLTLPNRLIWFAHCPKAGGTSIEKFMVSNWGDAVSHLHWGWDLWWRGGGWRVANPPNSPQHMIWADAQSQLSRAPDLIFAVVRNPADRMASEYRWQREKRRGTRLGKALAHLPFSLWLRVLLRAAQHHPYIFDNHFRPQADIVPQTAQVFHFEAGLEPVIHWLADVTDDTVDIRTIPHALRSTTRTEISPKDRALIGAAFAEDCRRFGYLHPKGKSTSWLDQLAVCIAPLVIFLDRRGAL